VVLARLSRETRPLVCVKKRAYVTASSVPGFHSKAEFHVVWFLITVKFWFLLVMRRALLTHS